MKSVGKGIYEGKPRQQWCTAELPSACAKAGKFLELVGYQKAGSLK